MDGLENIGRTTPIGMELDDLAKSYLNESAKWAKLLAIAGFIFIGFMVIIGIAMMVSLNLLNSVSNELSSLSGSMGIGLGFFYILMALIYLYPVWKLYEFANFSKQALSSNNSDLLTKAMESQKSMYKFWGILTAIILGLYVILFLLGLVGFVIMDLIK
ncbi:MAG: DUF5362 family protein [Saprospiraceae bacterium]